MKLCQKNNCMHLYSMYQAEFLKHLGSKLFSTCEHRMVPKYLQITKFQAMRENRIPYLWLIFWDNNAFPVQVIALPLSCNVKCVFQGSFTENHQDQSLGAAPYKGVHHWKAHSAFFPPMEMQTPHHNFCSSHCSMHSSNLYWGATAQTPLRQTQKMSWAGNRSSFSW